MPKGLIPFMFLIIPILEITVFVMVGGQIGIWMTLAMIVFTAIIGTILLRVQGFAILNRIQTQTKAGHIPGKELVNGVMIMIAGVLLLTPGFVTDGLGLMLFLPPFRQLIWSALASKFIITNPMDFQSASQNSQDFSQDFGQDEDVVDLDQSEFHEKTNTRKNKEIQSK